MSTKAKLVRKAASVILVAKNKKNNNEHNYDILLQKRQKSASSFANSVVFPGGVIEESDYGDEWFNHFRSFGIGREKFENLYDTQTTMSPLFTNEPFKMHTLLRISAIRETFEEAGILICRSKTENSTVLAKKFQNEDIKYWQKKVHDDPSKFLELFKELKCFPDIWSLHFWSNWLTPSLMAPRFDTAFMAPRFDTAFFVVGFDEQPEVSAEETEVAHFEWLSPKVLLEETMSGSLQAFPPQIYEMYRFLPFSDFEKLIQFAKGRSKFGCPLFYPFWANTADGYVSFLPGDSMYPERIDESKTLILDRTQYTMADLRKMSQTLNRFEAYTDKVRLRIQNLNISNYFAKDYLDEKVNMQVSIRGK